MYKFYRFIAHTPVMGEEQVFYSAIPLVDVGGVQTMDENYLRDVCDNFAEINCDDWWDEDHAEEFEEDEYYDMAYCEYYEITLDTFLEHASFLDVENYRAMQNESEEN